MSLRWVWPNMNVYLHPLLNFDNTEGTSIFYSPLVCTGCLFSNIMICSTFFLFFYVFYQFYHLYLINNDITHPVALTYRLGYIRVNLMLCLTN